MKFPCLAKANVIFSVGDTRTRRRRLRRRKVKGDAKKRRLSDEQVRFLEMSFRDERKLASGRKAHIAAELRLDRKQVAVWFQNRRARHKTSSWRRPTSSSSWNTKPSSSRNATSRTRCYN
ncbi:unnamed protein product [Musa banksii]